MILGSVKAAGWVKQAQTGLVYVLEEGNSLLRAANNSPIYSSHLEVYLRRRGLEHEVVGVGSLGEVGLMQLLPFNGRKWSESCSFLSRDKLAGTHALVQDLRPHKRACRFHRFREQWDHTANPQVVFQCDIPKRLLFFAYFDVVEATDGVSDEQQPFKIFKYNEASIVFISI